MDILKLRATLGLDDSEYRSGLSKAAGVAGSVGKSIAKGIGIAASAATTAVTAFAKSAVNTGMSFDSSMSQVAATMGLSMDEMVEKTGEVELAWGHFSGNLRDYAQEMGRNTAFSATEAADALNYMALAGYDVQTSMSMLPNVLNLAAAGNMDLARASDMVTDTQTAFGISLDRTSQMVDEMAKAASTGNTSVEQLGDAFLVVGGLAQELNGGMVTLADGTEKPVDGLQELEIALTAMANAGIKGSEAGTHMRNMLLKLSDPTDQGVAALEDMGVAIFDTEGKMRSLSDIFSDLNTQMGEMTQEQKIGVISDLFNTRDMASAEALLNAMDNDWDKIGASILEAEGAAEKMANTQLDNLAGDITLFKSALEGAKIAISDGLTPSIRKFVSFGTDGISKLTEAFKEGGITGAFGALGEVLSDGLNMIIENLPKAVDAGMQLLGALGQGILDNLPVIVDSAIQIVTMIGQGIIEALPALGSAATQLISQLLTYLLDNLPQIFSFVVTLMTAIPKWLTENAGMLIDGALAIVLGLVDALTDPDTLVGLVEVAINLILALVEGLIDAIPKLIEAAPKIIANLVEALIRLLPEIILAGAKLIMALGEGILKSVNSIIKVVADVWESIKGTWRQKIDDAKTWGRDMIDNFIGGIKEKWDSFKNTLSNLANTVKDFLGFSEPKKGPLSNFHTFAPDMMDLFMQGIKDNTAELQDVLSDSFNFRPIIDSATKGQVTSDSKSKDDTPIPINLNVTLEGGADRIFTVVREEDSKFRKANGHGALEYNY